MLLLLAAGASVLASSPIRGSMTLKGRATVQSLTGHESATTLKGRANSQSLEGQQ